MKFFLKILLHLLLFVFLTTLTQIGGIIYLLSLWIQSKIKKQFKFKRVIVFSSIYLFFSLIIIPQVAPLFGREPINNSNKIKPTNFFTILLNRNYVKPKMNGLLSKVEKELHNTNIHINYLDANFPFIDKFPLLPHLSHNDGKKLDISLVYKDHSGISSKQKSFTGYGVFVEPTKSEYNQIKKCKQKGYFQYDYPKYVKLAKINSSLQFSKKGTRQLIQAILKQPNLQKLFIEPHLRHRLQLNNTKIRYHGCRAVRHDDHIHIQIN